MESLLHSITSHILSKFLALFLIHKGHGELIPIVVPTKNARILVEGRKKNQEFFIPKFGFKINKFV
jgi:hypothetical protein